MFQLTNVYANSIMDLCIEKNIEKEVLEQLLSIKEIFDENNEVYTLIATPILTTEEKIKIIDDIFIGNDIYDVIINFIKVIIVNNRMSCFNKIVDEYKNIYYSNNNIIEVCAITVKKLSQSQLENLEKKLVAMLKQSLIIKNEIDTEIIGGILLKIKNKQIDSTIKHKLNQMSNLICRTVL